MRPWFLDPDSPSTCHCGFYTSRFILWVSVSFSGKQGVKSAGATQEAGPELLRCSARTSTMLPRGTRTRGAPPSPWGDRDGVRGILPGSPRHSTLAPRAEMPCAPLPALVACRRVARGRSAAGPDGTAHWPLPPVLEGHADKTPQLLCS